MKRLITHALVALALAVVGCDFNPAGPFEGFEGGDGATLTGVFQNGAVSAAPVDLRGQGGLGFGATSTISTDGYSVGVIVDGEEIGRVDVKGGTFTLRGLPDNFSLQFYDANDVPVGEPMEFSGVQPNQQIDLVVKLDENGDVELVEERRTGIGNRGEAIELEGRAREITVTSNDGMTGSLRVDDYHVTTRSGETSIRKGNRSLTLDDLDSGDRVHVRGMLEGDMEVFAWEIKLQEEDDDDDNSPSACNYVDPAKPNHILVCHKGKTLSISPDAWPGHAGHGDTCGPCGS